MYSLYHPPSTALASASRVVRLALNVLLVLLVPLHQLVHGHRAREREQGVVVRHLLAHLLDDEAGQLRHELLALRLAVLQHVDDDVHGGTHGRDEQQTQLAAEGLVALELRVRSVEEEVHEPPCHQLRRRRHLLHEVPARLALLLDALLDVRVLGELLESLAGSGVHPLCPRLVGHLVAAQQLHAVGAEGRVVLLEHGPVALKHLRELVQHLLLHALQSVHTQSGLQVLSVRGVLAVLLVHRVGLLVLLDHRDQVVHHALDLLALTRLVRVAGGRRLGRRSAARNNQADGLAAGGRVVRKGLGVLHNLAADRQLLARRRNANLLRDGLLQLEHRPAGVSGHLARRVRRLNINVHRGCVCPQ
eukprot:Rhum_TRINITY_DN14768_c20_g1::Rhum_TRINITY_DN14768_c20_g1_i1::g.117787::m.117787